MSYTHDDLSYRQYGYAPPTQGTSPVGTVYANGTAQGPGGSMSPTPALNALGPQAVAAAAPGGPQAPAMPQNQLMQPPPLQPPAWQQEWQKIYDQMAAIGHHDPQTVAYEEIGKYGLGPYAYHGPATGGVSGGGG